ncbi:MAG TPA: DUF6094 domain-containing protein, partial [Ktedonobacteraceae bacterium]|nr:DUF6094 domain-containing protein [Ktedonobacteraceae bacterium]
MSRTASQEKGLYYPTPEPIIPIIVQYLSSNYPSGSPDQEMRFLDPCVGKGRALALLAEEYRRHIREMYRYSNVFPTITTYGIEPNVARAKEAGKIVDDVLPASYFQCHISNGDYPDGGFQLAFVNPPYDYDKEGSRERLEITFLRRTTQKLCYNGVLIWVVPQWIVEKGAAFLSQWYTNIKVFRLPDDHFATPEMAEKNQAATPMFEMFHQVVVIGQKKSREYPDCEVEQELIRIGSSQNPHEDIALLAVLDERQRYHDTYTIPLAKGPLKYWSPNQFDPEEAAAQLCAMTNNKPVTGV